MKVARESHQENQNPNKIDGDDESEDTLSLCDLPIYGDAANWEDFDQSSSISSSTSSSSDKEYFEFFSEELNNTSSDPFSYPPETIIFCGKLIPPKEQHISSNLKSNSQPNNKTHGLLRWNSYSFYKSKSTSNTNGRTNVTKGRQMNKIEPKFSSSKSLQLLPAEKRRCNSGKSNSNKKDSSVPKVSNFTSPVKSKWYFIFGVAKFPAEMKLKDMRYRQSRRVPSTFFPSHGGGENVAAIQQKSGKGMWGLIRALSCGGGHHQTNAVVKASFGCIPLV